MSIPPLAANAVRDLLTDNIKRPDGTDATAFSQQRDALVSMRDATIDHESRLAAVEGQLASIPFPFAG